MNENIKISVVVPVYNAEKFLLRSTDSILNQTHKNIELILVNDGSKDNSLNLCYEIAGKDSRVKVFTKENGGAASARNLGIKNATGDYIGFCDADDYLDLDMYETLLDALLANNLSMVDCLYKSVNQEDVITYRGNDDRKLTVSTAREAISSLFYWIGGASLCTRLIKKSLFDNVNIPEGRRVEDFYASICLIAENGNNAVYNYPFYNYICNDNSVTQSKGASIYLDALYFRDLVLRKFGKKFDLYDASNYFLFKCYYLFSVSIISSELKIYKNDIKNIKRDLRNKRSLIINNSKLKKKEKYILILAAYSLRLTRLLYLIKNFLTKKW